MAKKTIKAPDYKVENILLMTSSFDAATPFIPEMKEFATIFIRKDCGVDHKINKAFYFTFPELSVDLVDTRAKGKNQKILSISLQYFVAFKLRSTRTQSDRSAFFRNLSLKTVWPFFARDVVDYTTRAGFAPIYIDAEVNTHETRRAKLPASAITNR